MSTRAMRPSPDYALGFTPPPGRARAALLLTLCFLLSFSTARAQTPNEETGQEETTKAAEAGAFKSVVRGRVIYQDSNRPLRRARVMLLPSDGRGGPEKTVMTNSRGEFRIESVRPGNFFVIVDAPGIITPFSLIDIAEVANEKAALMAIRKDFDEVSLNGTNTADVLVRAKRGGVISGKVTYSDGDAAVNVPVIIMRKREERLSQFILSLSRQALTGFRTDDRGFYRIAGLPPGEYIVGAAESFGREEEREDFADFSMLGKRPLSASYYQNETNPRQATPVKVEGGQDSGEINITLIERSTYTLSGSVVARGSRQPVRARMGIQPKDEDIQSPLFESDLSLTTDSEGRWTIPNVPDGAYVITVEPIQEYETATTMIEDTRPLPAGTNTRDDTPRPQPPRPPSYTKRQLEVTVSGADLSGINIELSEGGRIQGTVVVEGNKNLLKNGTSIFLVAANGKKPYEKSSYVTDSGKFLIDAVGAGEFYLYLPGLGEEYYVKSMTAGSTDLLREPLKMAQPGNVDNVLITVASDISTLTGRLISGEDNKPVRGASVLVVPADQTRWRVRGTYLFGSTDAEGAFKIAAPPGQYLVIPLTGEDQLKVVGEAFIRARAATARPVSLQPNGRETIELSIPAGAPR
jgi:hypothetical protein